MEEAFLFLSFFFFFFSHEKRKIPCDRRIRRLRGNMHGSWKKTGGRLGRRTSNGKRLFDADTFCSKFPQREYSFSDQFPPRIGTSFLKDLIDN
jgi:hypothetical protein